MGALACPKCKAPISWREILEESTMGLACRQCRTPLETDRRYRILALLVGVLVAALADRLWGTSPARQYLAVLLGFFLGAGLATLWLVQLCPRGDDQGFV